MRRAQGAAGDNFTVLQRYKAGFALQNERRSGEHFRRIPLSVVRGKRFDLARRRRDFLLLHFYRCTTPGAANDLQTSGGNVLI